MSVTQVVRDSTIVEHAKVAAQQKRRMFVVQLDVNAYDEAGSKLRPGLTRILEGIEEAGWKLDVVSPSESEDGAAARLFLFRPDASAQQQQSAQQVPQDASGQQPAYQQQTGAQQQPDPYGGYQQGYGYQYPPQYPGYDPQQYPGYYQQPGYGQQHPGYGYQQGW